MKNMLLGAVKEYNESMVAFNKHPDMMKSNPNTFVDPEGQKQVSDRFFGARDNLAKLAESIQREDDEVLATVKAWATAHRSAEECPKLVNAGNGYKAARRMEVLHEAEEKMWELLE